MSPPQKSRVVRRRVSGVSEPDEASDSKRPRKQPAAEPGPQSDNILKAPGKIIKVEAKNFMCHEHLSFPFNGSVNFITGQNGSGKSAVLTAVMVCLGGRASVTDRGTHLAALIRTGQRSASVAVTLQNCGNEAYKQELYGDVITVERVIRNTGSSYRLLSATGKCVSSKKKELIYILDALNIQVDNPVAILTQEMSKNFLRSDDPGDKYKLFMRATTLQQIQQGYVAARADMRRAYQQLQDKEKSLGTVREEVCALERQLNSFKNMHKMEEKVELLKKQLAWAKVAEAEDQVGKAQKECDTHEQKVRKMADRRDRCKQALDADRLKRQELEKQKAAVMAEMRLALEDQDRLKAEVRQRRDQHREASSQLRAEKQHADLFRSDHDRVQAEIQRQRTEAQTDHSAEEEQARQLEERLDAQVVELTGVEKTRHQHLQHCSETLRQQEAQLQQLRADEQQQRRETEALQRDLETTRSSQANPRALFGAWVAAVDRDVERCWQEKRFRKKPIGPVGAYIKLRAGCERWTPLVETSLAGLLKSYLVDDRQDMHVMTEILKRHCSASEPQKPRVITSRFLNRVHDVSQHGIDTSGQWVSVWSVLDIEHPVVANAVIDQTRAESVLLLATDEEARETMAYRERVPRGCSQALTLSGYRYYPDPSYRTYPVAVRRQPQFLQVSMEQAIANKQIELQRRRTDLQTASDKVTRMSAALTSVRQQEQQAQQQLNEGRAQLQTVTRKLRQLRAREKPQPINLQMLEEEVKSLSDSLSESEQKQDTLHQRVTEASAALQQAEDQKKALIEDVKSRFSDPTEAIEGELAGLESRRDDLQRNMARMTERLQGEQPQQQRLQQALTESERLREETTASAAALCERADVRVSRREVEARLEGVERSLREQRRLPQLSWEEVSGSYKVAQDKLQITEADVLVLRRELDKLAQMLAERDRMFLTLRESLAGRIIQNFHVNLDARNFEGKIEFDHGRRRLSVSIEPNRGGAGTGVLGSTLQLSGGERSVSTLAFVLAMWSAMHSPFRMLDEFDVFMDEVNRKISHDMLLKEALSRNCQFVFISPLTIDTQDNRRITVHRMHPPKRDAKV